MAPHDLREVALPTLDERLVASTLGRYAVASLKTYEDGQVLFEAGARDFKFFIVKSGQVEIVDPRPNRSRPSSCTVPASSLVRFHI
jgi:thioredoxin reductase (NADPH)